MIEQLNFDQTQVGGTLPVDWSNMKTLLSFSMHLSQIEGTLPTEWRSMQLEELDLSDTEIGGTLPRDWNQMSNITIIDLLLITHRSLGHYLLSGARCRN